MSLKRKSRCVVRELQLKRAKIRMLRLLNQFPAFDMIELKTVHHQLKRLYGEKLYISEDFIQRDPGDRYCDFTVAINRGVALDHNLRR